MRYLVLGVALVSLAIWAAISSERDKFNLCRSLGHGPIYCGAARAFSSN